MNDGASVERFKREVGRFRDFAEDVRATSMAEVRAGLFLVDCGCVKRSLVKAAETVVAALHTRLKSIMMKEVDD
eukprot:1917720-Pyramimonas_sp.AAC.1